MNQSLSFHTLIESLYGGISPSRLKKKRGIPPSHSLADYESTIERKAKDLVLAMTDHNIKEKNLHGSFKLNKEVIKNSKATRKTLISRGIIPESINPPEVLYLWSYALINGRLAEIYFDKIGEKIFFKGNCYVRARDTFTKREVRAIQHDINHTQLTYYRKKYRHLT